MKGRYGIRGAPNTGEGKTFIKGGSPQMIDRHPERLIRGNDADVSAEQGQERWMICPVCYFAIPAEGHQGGTVPHTEPWTRGECPNRGLVEVVPAADNRALREAAWLAFGVLYEALETVSGQGEKP